MSQKDKNLIKKLRKLNISNKRSKALEILDQYLKRYQVNDELLLEKAFFLYHIAFDILANKQVSAEDRKDALEKIKEAKKICYQIIKKDKLIKESITLNARIFLAQILAFQKDKNAITLAKENFRSRKDALTANRLANIFNILGYKKRAEYWYLKYSELGKKENFGRMFINGDLAIFYKKLGKDKKALEYYKKTLKDISNTQEGKSFKKILSQYFK